MSYFPNKELVVRYVEDQLSRSKSGSLWTMTIGRDKSGDFFAHTVIGELSADTGLQQEKSFYSELLNTSRDLTLDG